jgi:hypothetical protein
MDWFKSTSPNCPIQNYTLSYFDGLDFQVWKDNKDLAKVKIDLIGNIIVSTKQEMNITIYINVTTRDGTPYFYPITIIVSKQLFFMNWPPEFTTIP